MRQKKGEPSVDGWRYPSVLISSLISKMYVPQLYCLPLISEISRYCNACNYPGIVIDADIFS